MPWPSSTATAPRRSNCGWGLECANKIWLNGKLLICADVYHANGTMDQYVGRGELKAGSNVILLKICQNEQTEEWAQDWKFQLRVCDSSGKAMLATDRPAAASPTINRPPNCPRSSHVTSNHSHAACRRWPWPRCWPIVVATWPPPIGRNFAAPTATASRRRAAAGRLERKTENIAWKVGPAGPRAVEPDRRRQPGHRHLLQRRQARPAARAVLRHQGLASSFGSGNSGPPAAR